MISRLKHQPYFRLLSELLLAGTLTYSGSVLSHIDPNEPVENVSERSRVVYQLVDNRMKVTSYDTFADNPAARKQPFDQAITNDAPADLRFVIFDSVEQINQLDAQSKQKLLEDFNTGNTVIGANGFSKLLKATLGLLPVDLLTATTTTGGDDSWVLLKHMTGGYLSELEIAKPSSLQWKSSAFSDAVHLIRDWYNRNSELSLAATDSDDAWNAIYIYEFSGYSQATFESTFETAGTYKFTMSVFWLASDQDNSDWYRIDFQVISAITNYEMTGNKFGDTSGKCGWWTDHLHADLSVTTPGGQLFQFMPFTTVGSTSVGFTIGGEITTSQAGVTGAYSQSYGEPDVTITVNDNTVENTIDWVATPIGCGNYKWYPDYTGASSPAKSTYVLNPSLIIQVPEGSLLEAVSTDNSGATDTQVIIRKDKINLCGFLDTEVCWTEYFGTNALSQAVTCSESGCS